MKTFFPRGEEFNSIQSANLFASTIRRYSDVNGVQVSRLEGGRAKVVWNQQFGLDPGPEAEAELIIDSR